MDGRARANPSDSCDAFQQSMLQDPNRTPTAGPHHHQQYAGGHEDELSEAMFERLATELGGNDMHFGPI